MKIAVWYHCLIRGPRIHSEDLAVATVMEQMNALVDSGLAAAADQIHLGVNGTQGDALTVLSFAPANSILHLSEQGESELSTMRAMQAWLTPGRAVLYHHMKGAQHPAGAGFHNWRRSMEKVCVLNWRQCVAMLERDRDTCGAHWMTQKNGALPGQRYWAGNFWWARSDYLMTLPPLPEDRYESRYDAEDWIGKSPKLPWIKDFWPGMPLC